MAQISKITPTIYHPNWLTAAHATVSPKVQSAAQARLTDTLAAVEPGRVTPSWLTAKRQAHAACGAVFNAMDVVLGDSSKRHGLTGHAAHSAAFLGATVLSLPVWLCFDLNLSTTVLNRIHHLLLKPLTPVCILGAGVGLLLKSAAFVILYPTVLVGSFLVQVVQTPQRSVRPAEARPATDDIPLEDVSHLRDRHQRA